MVEYAYGSDHGGTYYLRITDRSDSSVAYYAAEADECGCAYECDCFDPVNREPTKFTFEKIA